MNWRSDFPFFVDNPLGYLDSAATAQKPRSVIDGMAHDYQVHAANVFRGVYQHAERTTERFDQARACIAAFVGAQPDELVITAGTTAGINLVAASWGAQTLVAGDEIIVSVMEHHSNLLAWQQLAERAGAHVQIVPITVDGLLDMCAYERLVSKRTKLVAITHTSNVLGTINDIAAIAQIAHGVGARVLVDAAQAVAHCAINVHKLGADFLVFSGHKLFGPTGVGGLYINRALHESIEPVAVGGGMIATFDWKKPTWLPAPRKFEAGTPPIIEVLGLARAIDYVNAIGFDAIKNHERILMQRAIAGLQQLRNVRLLGPIKQLAHDGHVLSFVFDGMHAHDVAAYLDSQPRPIAVRAGHHCASPLHTALGINASVRLSVALYNTLEEIDTFLAYMQQLEM